MSKTILNQTRAMHTSEKPLMDRYYNFNAGPAMLPTEVLQTAQAEMLNWHQTGMSLMEIGHRSSDFKQIIEETEADLRSLMAIPSHYKTLFVAGGASTQFAMVPLNLFSENNMNADYIETGVWSKKALVEASRYGQINIAAKIKDDDGYAYVENDKNWNLNPNAAYVHYTPNETISGFQFHKVPNTNTIPLVADMTSMILSQPIDVTQYGLIYAGAQKNLGQSGITLVIIREDLIKEPLKYTPTLYSYQIYKEHQSLYNTPPTYSWYIMGLVLKWLKKQGGVAEIYQKNLYNATRLYDIVEKYPDFFKNNIKKEWRSFMNVMFYLPNATLEAKFLDEAKKNGLINLKGHRVSGGIRASIYNAMPKIAVDKLAEFMLDFYKQHG